MPLSDNIHSERRQRERDNAPRAGTLIGTDGP